MKQTQNSSESGQVLVLLVLAMVGLLAFTALAIDGGLIYADRRGAQNAADASVLAGGYRIANTLEDFALGYTIDYSDWNCTNVQPIIDLYGELDAAQQAAANDYPITGDSTLDIQCHPGEDQGSYVDKYVEVQTEIVSTVRTAFVHFAFGGTVKNTVDAISRVRPRMPLGYGYPIYSHRTSCSGSTGGVRFDSGVTVFVDSHPGYGNGIMSDSCMSASGATVNADNGQVIYTTGSPPGGSITPAPQLEGKSLPISALLFPTPNCDDLGEDPSSSGNRSISPARFTSGITVNSGETLNMSKGLYCFYGNFTINGGTINGDTGVTIYMVTGNFSSVGTANVYLRSPTYTVNDIDGLTGVLIYMDEANAGQITLKGNKDLNGTTPPNFTNSYYVGTVYAAHDDSVIHVGGTGNVMTDFGTQLIAGTVWLHSTTLLNIVPNLSSESYDVYQQPARLTLEK